MTIATATSYIDLDYLGRPDTIAACVLESDSGIAIVDPGPGSTVETLTGKLKARGISVEDISTLLLTHIHLDHAGASGSLVRMNPRIQVYVHERGAPHMAEPFKLLESARRLYGANMQRLWGDFEAVPKENVHALKGGERLELDGRRLEVAYTPGHASHHVAYFDPSIGMVFAGDAVGIRITRLPFCIPYAPPPDIDVEAWHESLDRILRWRPQSLFATHFGASEDVEWHIADLRERLNQWAAIVKESLSAEGSDEDKALAFAALMKAEMEERLGEQDAERCLRFATAESCWYGLARYWRKRGA